MEDNKDTTMVDNTGDVPAKTYTEQELAEKTQESFNAGVKKANSEWQKDEKYKEFLNWKKNNQNDTEKMNELQTNNTNLENENKLLKAQIKVNASDVKKEFAKFVTSEVMGLSESGVDFETALSNFKKDNPQYFGETVIKKTQTSPTLTGGNQPQTTNSIMNNILRGN